MLYYDIQFGKGKARNPQKMTVIDDAGSPLEVQYRITPCRGVKLCGEQGCTYVTSMRENRSCPNHPSIALVSSGDCPVEFLYIKPTDTKDNRRWQTGIVRTNCDVMKQQIIHSHPVPPASKIPCKIQMDIQEAVSENPHLKTSDIVQGMHLCIYLFNILVTVVFV